MKSAVSKRRSCRNIELVGVNRDEARKAKETTRGYTSELGYMEAERWINSRFADPEIPLTRPYERRTRTCTKRCSKKRLT